MYANKIDQFFNVQIPLKHHKGTKVVQSETSLFHKQKKIKTHTKYVATELWYKPS